MAESDVEVLQKYCYKNKYSGLYKIPPYTPEMNPMEQIWKEIRKRGFKNEVFQTLQKVVDRLCDTILYQMIRSKALLGESESCL